MGDGMTDYRKLTAGKIAALMGKILNTSRIPAIGQRIVEVVENLKGVAWGDAAFQPLAATAFERGPNGIRRASSRSAPGFGRNFNFET
jgi:hypothetical protein